MRILSTKLAAAGLGLAATATVAIAVAPAAQADPPPPVTVICESATFYANYDSASGPVDPIDTKYAGQTVGFKKGSNPVFNGSWAQAFDWNLQRWGVILYSCLDHG